MQFTLFVYLFFIGFVSGGLYIYYYRIEYTHYSFNFARLDELKRTSAAGCSNLINLPCSLQTDVNVYFFWMKFMLVYYSTLIIAMVYTWHRTVRLSSCFLTLLLTTAICFGTDLILYFDDIFLVSSMVCISLIVMFPFLSGYLSRNIDDPLSLFCGYGVPPDNICEFLQNDASKRACFYRWTKKMKKKWNIEEEKLAITITVGIITSIIITILAVPLVPFVHAEIKNNSKSFETTGATSLTSRGHSLG